MVSRGSLDRHSQAVMEFKALRADPGSRSGHVGAAHRNVLKASRHGGCRVMPKMPNAKPVEALRPPSPGCCFEFSNEE
jgi:hypothetical protein